MSNLIDLDRMENQLMGAPLVVLDLETSGLDWKKDDILSIALAFSDRPEDVHYIPVGHGNGNHPKAQEIQSFIFKILGERQDIKIIGHNLMFDLLFIRAAGGNPQGRFYDTMVQAALLDEFAKSYKLKDCAERMKVEAKKDDQLFEYMAEYFKQPLPADGVNRKIKNEFMGRLGELPGDAPAVIDYVKGDVITTWQLYTAQAAHLSDQGLTVIADLESRTMAALLDMQYSGIPVDEDELAFAIQDTRENYDRLLLDFPQDFNLWASASVRKLFDGYDQNLIPKTPKGGLSFKKEFLATDPLGQRVLEVRQLGKLLNFFLEPIRDDHLFEGRVHPAYHQARGDDFGTVTGRLSSTNPNIQQIPARDVGRAKIIRSLFKPDEGFLWSSNDLSQAEYRLFAHYAQDEKLIAGYCSVPSTDMHTVVSEILSVDRFTAKTLNFSILYGAGIKKIAAQLGVSVAEAQAVRDAYFERLPSVPKFMRATSQAAEERCYVKTILGRRCRFGYNLEDKYYKAANRIIQGSNADYTKLKLSEIHEYFKSEGGTSRIILTVHDSIDWQFEDSERGRKQDAEARRIFENRNANLIKLRVPMEVTYGIGKNWAEAK